MKILRNIIWSVGLKYMHISIFVVTPMCTV